MSARPEDDCARRTMVAATRVRMRVAYRVGPVSASARCASVASASLHGEAIVDDVAVLDDVVLPFEPELPRLPALRLGAELDEVVERHHLGPDEAALDVAVNAS